MNYFSVLTIRPVVFRSVWKKHAAFTVCTELVLHTGLHISTGCASSTFFIPHWTVRSHAIHVNSSGNIMESCHHAVDENLKGKSNIKTWQTHTRHLRLSQRSKLKLIKRPTWKWHQAIWRMWASVNLMPPSSGLKLPFRSLKSRRNIGCSSLNMAAEHSC